MGSKASPARRLEAFKDALFSKSSSPRFESVELEVGPAAKTTSVNDFFGFSWAENEWVSRIVRITNKVDIDEYISSSLEKEERKMKRGRGQEWIIRDVRSSLLFELGHLLLYHPWKSRILPPRLLSRGCAIDLAPLFPDGSTEGPRSTYVRYHCKPPKRAYIMYSLPP